MNAEELLKTIQTTCIQHKIPRNVAREAGIMFLETLICQKERASRMESDTEDRIPGVGMLLVATGAIMLIVAVLATIMTGT